MRLLETIQFGVLVCAIAVPVIFGRRLRRGRMAVALIGSMVAQLVVERYRWQLLPLEIGTLLLAAGDALWEDRRFRGLRRLRRGALGILGTAMVAILPTVMPVPAIPAPSGAFDVGTTTVVLEDAERTELYGLPEPDPEAADEDQADSGEEAPGEQRRIVVQVWYPAMASEEEPVRWNPDIDILGPEIAGRLGLPGFALDHTAGAVAHARSDALPLDGVFPVVLWSHDWAGFRTDSVDHVESLASHGFVVLVPDHTYASLGVRFPDDESIALLDERILPPEDEETDPEAYLESAVDLVEVMADDLILILDRLEAGPEGDFAEIVDHADLEHIGVYGHGTGGGAASRLCLVDDRCDAVLGADPWVEPIPDRTVAREFQVPSLMLRSDGWRDTPNDRRLRGMAERSPMLSYWIGIDGAGHNDFVMAPLLSPFAGQLGWKGPIDANRVMPIVDSYVVAFFERFLLGVGGSVLDQPPPPEVELELIR